MIHYGFVTERRYSEADNYMDTDVIDYKRSNLQVTENVPAFLL